MKTLIPRIILIACVLYNVAYAEPGTTGVKTSDILITTLSGGTYSHPKANFQEGHE